MDGGGGYRDYGSPKEDPESKFVDVYYHPHKEEPGPKLDDGDVVDVNSYRDYGPLKEEPKSELDVTDGDGGDTDDCDPPKEDWEPEFVDVCYRPLKEEPKQELSIGDGDAVDVDDYHDCDPLKKEPEQMPGTTGNDAVADGARDVSYDCSHCRISLSTEEFKVEHELRCKVFKKRKELESQITKLYHCCYCRCPFLSKEYKEQHQQKWCPKRPITARKNSNNGTNFECDKCKFVTKWKDSLSRHVLNHNKNEGEWFTCTHCSYKAVHKYSMTRHMKIHGNTYSCCCSICGKSFRRKLYLDDHLLRRHSDESDEVSKLITSKVYTCHICDKYRTVMKTNFNNHLTVTHLKGVGCEKYECSQCSYSTFSKGNLTVHSKTHAEQKDYQCAVCKKQFTQKLNLHSHILYTHSKNEDLVKTITSKIYRCESCSFKTLKKNKLKSHVQSKHI